MKDIVDAVKRSLEILLPVKTEAGRIISVAGRNVQVVIAGSGQVRTCVLANGVPAQPGDGCFMSRERNAPWVVTDCWSTADNNAVGTPPAHLLGAVKTSNASIHPGGITTVSGVFSNTPLFSATINTKGGAILVFLDGYATFSGVGNATLYLSLQYSSAIKDVITPSQLYFHATYTPIKDITFLRVLRNVPVGDHTITIFGSGSSGTIDITAQQFAVVEVG